MPEIFRRLCRTLSSNWCKGCWSLECASKTRWLVDRLLYVSLFSQFFCAHFLRVRYHSFFSASFELLFWHCWAILCWNKFIIRSCSILGWSYFLSRDGVHLSGEGSKIVVKEILKILKEADWEPDLHWKSMASEFGTDSPFDFVGPDGKTTLNASNLNIHWETQWE